MTLQRTGIDHLSVACSAAGVGKKSDTEAPSEQIRTAADKIYRLAKAKGFTIEDLARKAGRPFQTFNNWKNGHTTAKLETLEAFAEVVGATVSLRVTEPGESAGLEPKNPETRMIAQLIDALPERDRKLWLDRIDEYATKYATREWEVPSEPPADLSAPRGRSKTGSRR